jgi:NADP-dependent 3-hydroxy acid dehydrogenase YdfG
MAKLELKGRAAIVTGAGSGIGRALAMEAAMRGMSVGIADVNPEGLKATEAALLDRQAKVLSRVVDVRSAEQVEDFAAACAEAFPSIAEVWANAGLIRYNSAIKMNLADWNIQLDVNLRGVVHCIAAFLPRLLKQNEPAQLILTGSQASFIAAPELAAYAGSKHAVWAIADCMKYELMIEKSPVQMSVLCPPRTATGLIATTIARTRAAKGEEGVQALLDVTPTPESIAHYAMEKAEQRDFLILPEFKDVHANIESRFKAVVDAGAQAGALQPAS